MTQTTFVPRLIQDRRERRGLNQDELAAQMGVHRNTISRWENGHHPPTAPQRKKLARTLGGHPTDYKWTEDDHEQHERLARIKIEAAAYVRRLMAGEEL